MLGLPDHHSDVGSEELVGTGGDEVGAEPAQREQAVGGVMHRVHIHQRPGGVGRSDDVSQRGDRPESIGGGGDRHQAGTGADCTRHRRRIEGAIGRIEVHGAHHHAAVGGRQPPWGHIGVVVQRGDHDLVSRHPTPRQGA